MDGRFAAELIFCASFWRAGYGGATQVFFAIGYFGGRAFVSDQSCLERPRSLARFRRKGPVIAAGAIVVASAVWLVSEDAQKGTACTFD
jgi:hypothetical protein